MKKLVLLCSFGLLGSFAMASSNVENGNIKTTLDLVTECVTQTTTDPDGDIISVTCCRTTYDEAFNCAADKLKKAVKSQDTGLDP